jgi:hypothetical protein
MTTPPLPIPPAGTSIALTPRQENDEIPQVTAQVSTKPLISLATARREFVIND